MEEDGVFACAGFGIDNDIVRRAVVMVHVTVVYFEGHVGNPSGAPRKKFVAATLIAYYGTFRNGEKPSLPNNFFEQQFSQIAYNGESPIRHQTQKKERRTHAGVKASYSVVWGSSIGGEEGRW